MNVEYIEPFVASTVINFEKMTRMKAVKNPMSISKIAGRDANVVCVIGISGELIGSTVITLSQKLALFSASMILHEKFIHLNADVLDAIGELTNIIIGNARSALVNDGIKIDISTPTLIHGEDLEVSAPKNRPFLVTPFKTNMGGFKVYVSLAKE